MPSREIRRAEYVDLRTARRLLWSAVWLWNMAAATRYASTPGRKTPLPPAWPACLPPAKPGGLVNPC
jgi:hypothetical protein